MIGAGIWVLIGLVAVASTGWMGAAFSVVLLVTLWLWPHKGP